MMENNFSESFLDWFLRSCQLAQGNAGFRSNIFQEANMLSQILIINSRELDIVRLMR